MLKGQWSTLALSFQTIMVQVNQRLNILSWSDVTIFPVGRRIFADNLFCVCCSCLIGRLPQKMQNWVDGPPPPEAFLGQGILGPCFSCKGQSKSCGTDHNLVLFTFYAQFIPMFLDLLLRDCWFLCKRDFTTSETMSWRRITQSTTSAPSRP